MFKITNGPSNGTFNLVLMCIRKLIDYVYNRHKVAFGYEQNLQILALSYLKWDKIEHLSGINFWFCFAGTSSK